jgi:putative transcriptional regulator
MTTTVLKPTKGRLLISVPFMNDFYFGRSVVLLTEHNDEGSVGFILNKPIETKVGTAISDFPDFNGNLYMGGPVEKSSLFYIHTLGTLVKDSIEVSKGLYWGGNFATIKKLIETGVMSEDDIRFFVGYSGWGKNQLEKELTEKSWVVTERSAPDIMSLDPDSFWKDNIKATDKQLGVWADFPVNPSLN